MRLLEREAKDLLRAAGVPTPRYRFAADPEGAARSADEVGWPAVLKVQVPVGGRGKAGGVVIVRDEEEAERTARDLLSREFSGHRPEGLLVEEFIDVEDEVYAGCVLDRSSRSMVFVTTPHGGMDIEEAARRYPDDLLREEVDPLLGLLPHQARRLAANAVGDGGRAAARAVADVISSLWRLIVDTDALLLEVNPLGLLGDGTAVALDAHLEVDDNALFRHKEFGRRPSVRANPREAKAEEAGLAYVELDGDVGTVANGAGLAMATMDLVSLMGGRPANFCDVGGGASADRVAAAMEIITSNPRVRNVVVNALCGITSGEEVARGIVEAVESVGLSSNRLYVRLSGNAAEEGRRILREAGLTVFEDPVEAVRSAIAGTRRGTETSVDPGRG